MVRLNVSVIDSVLMFRELICSQIARQEVFQVNFSSDRGLDFIRDIDTLNTRIVILSDQIEDIRSHRLIQLIHRHDRSMKIVCINHDRHLVVKNRQYGQHLSFVSDRDSGIEDLMSLIRSQVSDDYSRFCRENPGKGYTVFTRREISVLKLISQGFTTQEISEELHISESTVYVYRKSMLHKADVRNISELIVYCIESGIL